MAKGKKRKSPISSAPKKAFSHDSAFSTLKGAKIAQKTEARATPPPVDAPETTQQDPEGLQLWKRFHEGVIPMDTSNVLPCAPPIPREDPPRPPDEKDMVMAELADLISGEGEFAIEFLDEFVTGIAPGVDLRLLKKLKAGSFSYQSYLDLHGHVWNDAREIVLAFINRAIREGKRCVLIVHGRGLHSKGEIATLKKNLISLLTRGPLRRKVLAFSSARNVDGGPGALYLLLRKARTPHG
ncbi:Smr/MutS family protein [Myxococcota bacterium]|nr:Smr/MutS family protein [Myxococcota bacterium]